MAKLTIYRRGNEHKPGQAHQSDVARNKLERQGVPNGHAWPLSVYSEGKYRKWK